MAFRSAIYKCDGISLEVRSAEPAVASMFASRLPHATKKDVTSLHATMQYPRPTAARPATVWDVDPLIMTFASMSDAGGAGSLTNDRKTRQEPGW